ncbi:hypothetical protein HYV86_03125 [Candidatus Woesearchaeota archaeon]|nr:hypothetical protein [Candidatus Woesearchaeota archaeon]
MIDPIFRITQLTLPVATILSTAWVLVSGNNSGALLFFIGGVIFTIILRLMEQAIFEHNVTHGRYRNL